MLRCTWTTAKILTSAKKCVDDGFTSVMVDGSKHPFEENIALTKQVVDYAHARGVVVEAELGKLAGVEDNIKVDARSATFTDPDEAAEFVERTGVDSSYRHRHKPRSIQV